MFYSSESSVFACRCLYHLWFASLGEHLLCFIHYNLGYFSHLGNTIVVYSSIDMVFAHWWSFKFLSLWILCKKWNFSDTPPGSLPRVPSLFRVPNGFTGDLLEYYVIVTQTVRDISSLMPMHQDPLLVRLVKPPQPLEDQVSGDETFRYQIFKLSAVPWLNKNTSETCKNVISPCKFYAWALNH